MNSHSDIQTNDTHLTDYSRAPPYDQDSNTDVHRRDRATNPTLFMNKLFPQALIFSFVASIVHSSEMRFPKAATVKRRISVI
jgi:hypothetical protein